MSVRFLVKCTIWLLIYGRFSISLQGTGSYTESDTFRSEVSPVARFAVDLALPLTQHAAVHPLVAEVAGEAGLVPRLARRPHQLGYEDRFSTSRTDVGTAPLGPGFSRGYACGWCGVFWHYVGGIVWHEWFSGRYVGFGFVINLIRIALVPLTIIHRQGSRPASETIALRTKIFPVA